jgi:hypothetical protein
MHMPPSKGNRYKFLSSGYEGGGSGGHGVSIGSSFGMKQCWWWWHQHGDSVSGNGGVGSRGSTCGGG